MNRNGPPAARILIEEREVGECSPAGRCVPKLENPIMERIMESSSSSDIFGPVCGWVYCSIRLVGRFVKAIAVWKTKNLFMEIMLLMLPASIGTTRPFGRC